MRLRLHRAIAAAVVSATLAVAPALADMKAANAAYAKLLAKYVTTRGVRYAPWRTNGDDLKLISEVVMLYRSTETKLLEPNERKALMINLYNAKILETVLLMTPSGSILSLSKWLRPHEIFHRPAMMLDGKAISLDDLEKRLRVEFKDPRIHFALCSSARSSPPIRSEPYAGARLEEQLDDATRSFLAAPDSVVVKTTHGRTTLLVSRLFAWYENDFKPVAGVLPFIGMYGPKEAADAAATRKAKLEYQDYNWGLNVAD